MLGSYLILSFVVGVAFSNREDRGSFGERMGSRNGGFEDGFDRKNSRGGGGAGGSFRGSNRGGNRHGNSDSKDTDFADIRNSRRDVQR